jgi:tRNA G37 N-methylase TrmD
MLLLNEKVVNQKFSIGDTIISTDEHGFIEVPKDAVDAFLASGFRVAQKQEQEAFKNKSFLSEVKVEEADFKEEAEIKATEAEVVNEEDGPRRRWRRRT